MAAPRDTADPRLALEPAPAHAKWLLFALSVALPLVLVVVLPQAGGDEGPAGLHLGAALGIAVLLLAMFVLMLAMMRRHRLLHDAAGIELATTFYTRRLAWPELRLQDARVVSLDERTELKPSLKSNGMSLPGFRSGWFRSRHLKKLLVATAGGDRVLWLPTTRDFDLLLQPRNPRAALDRLRELAAMAPERQRNRNGNVAHKV